MVLFNYSTRELTAKIVYYGPGLCGKTTNLQYIHSTLPENVKGKMLSLATKTDRTLFFDFLPIDLGEIRGMKTRVQLYTVPGQVFYNETRKLVLKGADGIVFVADSQAQMQGANVESFKNLEDNLRAHGLNLAEMPHVIQFNKRDLPKLSSIEELNGTVNKFNAPFYESVATTGIGVQDTLKAITKLVLLHLTKKYDPKATGAAASTAKPTAAPTPAPAAIPEPAPVPARAVADATIPLARPSGSESVAPAAATARSSAPAFASSEIDALVDEVSEIELEEPVEAAAPVAEPPAEGPPAPDEPRIELEELDSLQIDDEPARPAARSVAADVSGDDSPAFEIDHAVDPDWNAARRGRSSEPPEEQVADPHAIELTGDADEAPMELATDQAVLPTADSSSVDPSFFDEAPEPVPAEELSPTDDDGVDEPVPLTDVASDADLFEDPSIDVARMATGEEQEILVPVEIGGGAEGTRRFKLSIRLRLDALD